MPGPGSRPQARTASGILLIGKTKLKSARLKSGQGMNYANPISKEKREK